jgi:hypothetical protein
MEVIDMKLKDESRRPALRRILLATAFTSSLAILGIAQADPSMVTTASALGSIMPGETSATAGAMPGMAEQRVRVELRAVMAELVESGAFGSQPSRQIALDVNTPAQRVSDLGLLVDSAHPQVDGLHVLAVTPDSNADRMGLRAGDVLLALNGASFANDSSAAATLRNTIEHLPDRSALAFDVERDGRQQTVSGTLASVYLPPMHLTVGDTGALASTATAATPMVAATAAADPAPAQQGCGRISDFDSAPRQQDLHAAKIMLIDGVTPGPSGTKSFRVNAGSHTLKVAEQIESRYLGFNDRARNAGKNDRYKTLRVDVAPDTTVLIAAHLNPDKRNDPSNGVFWNPVAWKQITESCR